MHNITVFFLDIIPGLLTGGEYTMLGNTEDFAWNLHSGTFKTL